MKSRLDLQKELETMLNSKQVYYNPPENLKMEYPAIRYSKGDINASYGDGIKYIKQNVYDIVVIDKKPDNKVIDMILELPYSSFERHYVSDGLHHDIIRLYY